ncbi:MAG: peptidoglycan DD-metalloendopeptidase family protein [Pseudomonadales bacterium]|jgi:murein DD-endopeptidase MepM/ murein hydrolase activator NlpD
MSKLYPKSHLLIISAVTAIIGLLLLVAPSEDVSARRAESLPLPTDTKPSEEVAIIDKEPAKPVENWHTVTVKSGDSLTTLFLRANLTARDVYRITEAAKDHESTNLHKLRPGQSISVVVKDGHLEKLRHQKNRLESTLFTRTESGYDVEEIVRTPDIHTRFATADLENSLFLAGQKAELPQKTIMELANIFGGVIDFILDPRRGDSFTVLYEEQYLDGEKIGVGNIISAQYINQGDVHTAIRYISQDGKQGYYTPEGISMRKAFLRSPVDFTRISSGFNLQRKHPIHKKVKAHRGIDYAAPTGTPIVSPGDGRVVRAGYSEANGNFLVIQHGQQYTTKYLHLSKRHVKRGDKVKQGQLIGRVGATGWATGPHLHYEFLVNGVHRNPRTILDKLPKAKAISDEEMPIFKQMIQPALAQLDAHQEWLAYNR